jgi:hypothetical protein
VLSESADYFSCNSLNAKHTKSNNCYVKLLMGYLGLRRRWKDNIKIVVQKKGCQIVDWMHLAQNRVQKRVLVTKVLDLRVPS